MAKWNIQRAGRSWGDDALSRYDMTPEKIEMIAGRLFASDEERETMLGLLLENVGVDAAVRLGDARAWRAAIEALHSAPSGERADSEPPDDLPIDRRALEAALLTRLSAHREALSSLLTSCSDHWGFEDPVYRFYHDSFKVYALQGQTSRIVSELRQLLPERPLNPWFLEIVQRGVGNVFDVSDDSRWTEVTRRRLRSSSAPKYRADVRRATSSRGLACRPPVLARWNYQFLPLIGVAFQP